MSMYNERYKSHFRQARLPAFLSNVYHKTQSDRIKNIQKERWIDRFPSDASRLLDASNSSFSSSGKVKYYDLPWHYSGTVNLTPSLNNQHNANIDTTETGGRDLTSQVSFFNSDPQSSRLVDPIANHAATEAKSVRSSSSFKRSSKNPLISWQKYCVTKYAHRERTETNNPKPILHHSKYEQLIPGQAHFIVFGDSPYLNSEYHNNNQAPSSTRNRTRVSTAVKSNKNISSTTDDHINKDMNQVPLIELTTSALIPSSTEIVSSSIVSKTSIINSSNTKDKYDEQNFIEKSFLLSSSSNFKNDSQIIEEVTHAKQQLPSERTNPEKYFSTKNRIPSDRKRQISKHSLTKWYEPYVGLRCDPPAPPCSPTLVVWAEDNDTPFETSQVFEHNLPVQVLESYVF